MRFKKRMVYACCTFSCVYRGYTVGNGVSRRRVSVHWLITIEGAKRIWDRSVCGSETFNNQTHPLTCLNSLRSFNLNNIAELLWYGTKIIFLHLHSEKGVEQIDHWASGLLVSHLALLWCCKHHFILNMPWHGVWVVEQSATSRTDLSNQERGR